MSTPGSQLRQARETQSLSLDQVQKATRIKRAYIEAMEADRLNELPGPVQARGFVRSYAAYLGLNPDELAGQPDSAPIGAAVSVSRPQAATTDSPPREPARVRSMALSKPAPIEEPGSDLPLPLPLLIAGAIVLFVIGGYLLIRAFGGESPAPTPTLPANVPASVSLAPGPAPTVALATGVSLTLKADEHVWVRVTEDGITAFEGMLQPDEAQTWKADQQVIVETGNGAALNAEVNGQSIGLVGPRGRVVVRAWGPQGEVTPAPTAVPATSIPPTPARTLTQIP